MDAALRALLDTLSERLRQATDAEISELLFDGALDRLILSIFDSPACGERSFLDWMLANRVRAGLVGNIHHNIEHNFAGRFEGTNMFVTPAHFQWFDDGVIFRMGTLPFEGLIGVYRTGEVRLGMFLRDMYPGQAFKPEDIEFVSLDVIGNVSPLGHAPDLDLDEPVRRLTNLLETGDNTERHYQELLERYPWSVGLHYKRIDRHEKLDDANIPDFTGVRARDDNRDIIEVKPPFMPIAKVDEDFTAEFNAAWNQAERYLHFVRKEQDYLLRQKALAFDAPRCVLLIGHRLSPSILRRIRMKEQMNPAIEILTYDDLLQYMMSTTGLLKQLRQGEHRGKAG